MSTRPQQWSGYALNDRGQAKASCIAGAKEGVAFLREFREAGFSDASLSGRVVTPELRTLARVRRRWPRAEVREFRKATNPPTNSSNHLAALAIYLTLAVLPVVLSKCHAALDSLL